LQGNQEEIDRFAGVTAGTVPVGEFFATESIAGSCAALRLGRPEQRA
jgi:hypothetical protein